MTIENGAQYPVMLYMGANGQKYDTICTDVRDFKCAMYLTDDILEANPDLNVSLELCVVDNSAGANAAAEELTNPYSELVYTGAKQVYTDEEFVIDESTFVAEVDGVKYGSLETAIANANGKTVTIIGVVNEGTIKLPATLKNVTIKGSENGKIVDTTIVSADGDSLIYENITIDSVVFENSNINITGWRNGTESYKNWTITKCTFNYIVREGSHVSAVHINNESEDAVNGLTFTNNKVNGISGGQNAALCAFVTGDVTISGNEIAATTGNSLTLYVVGKANAVVSNNRFESWGGCGEGRVIRATVESAASKLTVEKNVMIHENAPEQFIKVTGADVAAAVSVNKNYWNGASPVDEGIIEIEGEKPENYYSDKALTNLVTIEEVEVPNLEWTEVSLTLGSNLKMNFYVYKEGIVDGVNYYAKIVKIHGDGCADGVEVDYISISDWEETSTEMRIVVDNIAAKEMNCTFAVAIYAGEVPAEGESEGKRVTGVAQESIVNYAKWVLRDNTGATAEEKTLMVDLLNYGAAAQVNFGHYAEPEHLANYILTDDEKAFATADDAIIWGNYISATEKYYALETSLELEETTYLNFYFANIKSITNFDESLLSVNVSFTDHLGKEHSVTIKGSDLVWVEESDGIKLKVSVTDLAAADANIKVTCAVTYNESVISSVTANIADYCEYYVNDDTSDANLTALCKAIMKYATSAYKCFHE